jgi:hypothetical protein
MMELSTYYLIQNGREHLSEISGYDPSYDLVYYNSWSSYEESGWLAILEKNFQFFIITGGYSVMCEGPQDDVWQLDPIAYEQAIQEIIDFDKICNDVE